MRKKARRRRLTPRVKKDNDDEKKDSKSSPGVKCFVCDKRGHISSKCPMKKLLNSGDDSSVSSKSSKLDELEKTKKKVNKQFTQMKASNAIALHNKYNERKQPPTAASEGTAFAQKGKKKTTDTKSKKKDARTMKMRRRIPNHHLE